MFFGGKTLKNTFQKLGFCIQRDPRMLCNIDEYLSLNSKNNVSLAFS